MADQEKGNEASGTDQRPRGSARNQEQLVERHPRHEDPTRLDEERTSDNSTVDNGGLAGGREENPALPDEPTLRTEI